MHVQLKENRMSTKSSTYFNISYFLYSVEWIVSNIGQESHIQVSYTRLIDHTNALSLRFKKLDIFNLFRKK